MIRFIAGAAVGYVLGAKAGRQRYEAIKRASAKIAANPAVKSATGTVLEQVHQLADHAREAISRS